MANKTGHGRALGDKYYIELLPGEEIEAMTYVEEKRGRRDVAVMRYKLSDRA